MPQLNVLIMLCVGLCISACARGPLVKANVDNEVRELCTVDGGIKVFETATLPADMFDQYGNPKIRAKENSTSDDDYYYEWDIHDIRTEPPQISRSHHTIVRRRDAKVMGESIRYMRKGGDMFGPWHDSNFTCPAIGSEPNLGKSVFRRAESK